jgi:hypothetical protein
VSPLGTAAAAGHRGRVELVGGLLLVLAAALAAAAGVLMTRPSAGPGEPAEGSSSGTAGLVVAGAAMAVAATAAGWLSSGGASGGGLGPFGIAVVVVVLPLAVTAARGHRRTRAGR